MKNLTSSLIVAIVTLFGASAVFADNHANKADAAATTTYSTPAAAKAGATADAKAEKKAKKKKVHKAKKKEAK